MNRILPVAIYACILLTACATTAHAAALEGLTLDEALRLAEQSRPELEALRHRIKMAEGEARQAGLWPNPTISLGMDSYTPHADNRPPDLAKVENLVALSNRVRAGANAPDSSNELWAPSIPEPDNPDQLQQVISISQPLPLWGAQRQARAAGKLEMERWKLEYIRTRLELRLEVGKAFDEVVYRQESLHTAGELERTLTEILDVTRARFEAGDIAEVELIKGKADHERFRLEMEAARSELSQSKARLAGVLGAPDLVIGNCAGTTATPLPEPPEESVARLKDDHPQARIWEKAEEAARARVAVVESRRWPVPTLGFGYRHYEYADQDTFDLSLEFELPLFDRKQGEVQAARENAKFQAATVRADRNAFETRLQESVAAFTAHRSRAASFAERIIPRMEQTLEIVRSSHEAGDISMLEVLDAYRSLAEARMAYLREAFEARSAFHDVQYLLAGETQPAE
ncbi:MAG: TolC family protein [Candidatus Hydrogenedentes bacterium]|nr:TolC family protein [Candidatus Hydrogenedentota bacterium]